MAVAVAISIALHEVAAGLVPRNITYAAPAETVTHARILRVARRPAPTTTPYPRTTRSVIDPRAIASSPRPAVAHTTEGRSGHHNVTARVAFHQPQLRKLSNSKPVWEVATGGPNSRAFTGTGNAAGSGNGSGTRGNGTGSVSGNEPCGFVTFSDPHGSQFDPRTRGFWVDIRMSVHFADGSSQSMILDYPWYYANETANPWSDQNLKDPSFPTRFQSPPPNKIAEEPPLVHYVVTHSTPDGLTLLKDCPQSGATPAAQDRSR